MQTLVSFIFLLINVLPVLCVPPRCHEVNVETEQIIGRCCLHVKNEFFYEREKVVERFLDSINTDPNANRGTSSVHKIIYPDVEMKHRPQPTERRVTVDNNPKNTNHPDVKTNTVTVKQSEGEDPAINITLGTRVNVDVQDMPCAEGYQRNSNGACMEVFGEIE